MTPKIIGQNQQGVAYDNKYGCCDGLLHYPAEYFGRGFVSRITQGAGDD
jgi:hypothetical protein